MSATSPLLLVTGATGLVGSHVVERALQEGWRVRVLVRSNSGRGWPGRDVDIVEGALTQAEALASAARGVTHVVHCAARVGDWGPVEAYREINVRGLRLLVEACRRTGAFERLVHISSLGVYPARDHWGSDETAPLSSAGIDGYTRSKIEAEQWLRPEIDERKLPAVILRPGFIYGPRDRSVLPRLLTRLRAGRFSYLGDRTKLMNNTFVNNLVDVIYLALGQPAAIGEAFNVTDGRLVTKEEFVGTIAEGMGLPRPKRQIPLAAARVLAAGLETLWRWRGKGEAPILSRAGIKLLGLNLDYSSDKSRRVLGYHPKYDFQEGIQETLAWFREQDQS